MAEQNDYIQIKEHAINLNPLIFERRWHDLGAHFCNIELKKDIIDKKINEEIYRIILETFSNRIIKEKTIPILIPSHGWEYEVEKTWFQVFKRECFPRFLLKLFPIKTKKIYFYTPEFTLNKTIQFIRDEIPDIPDPTLYGLVKRNNGKIIVHENISTK